MDQAVYDDFKRIWGVTIEKNVTFLPSDFAQKVFILHGDKQVCVKDAVLNEDLLP